MFMYPYVHGPLAEDTGPGFAYSHHQLPATISSHTGNPDSFYTRISGTLKPSETVSVLNRLSNALIAHPSQTLPLYIRSFPFTMIAFPCVYCVT